MSKENIKTIKITSEYITLGQFLKFTKVISNGGEAKFFIANNKIFLNGQQIFERGKKFCHTAFTCSLIAYEQCDLFKGNVKIPNRSK